MLKRFFSMLGFLLVALASQAENAFSVDAIDIKQGEEKVISVSLTNDAVAASAAIDITLPEGLSFVDQGSVVFSSRADGMMQKSSNIRANGDLRVGMAFGSIPAGSGELFTFKIKANQDASLGTVKVKYSNMSLTINSASTKIADMESAVNIVKFFSVAVQTDGYTGGSVAVTQGTVGNEVASGSTIQVTATAEEGYHFVKWSDEATDNPYTFTVSSDVSLTAEFAPNQYTITFDSDGGTEVAAITADYKSTLTKPADPTKTGYTFAGWNPAFPETMPLNGATLKATWTPVSYTISYDLAGGALASGVTNPNSYTIESDAITLNNPVREGYTFAGWTGTDLVEATMAVTVAKGSIGNRSFTATWSINQYTMTFVLDNGEDNVVKTQDYGTELTAPTDPVKTGFTFKGWEPAVPATIPAQDMTFTAQWERNKYLLTFIVDGETYKQEEVLFEAAITKPENPVKEGYTFTGWNPEVAETMPAENLTYTATWSINQYTMTFAFDNGEENVVKTQDYGTELTAPTDPVKTGFTFKGWEPAVPATIPAQDMTITAQWERNKYLLTFIVDGETYKQEEVLFEAAITKPEDPVKEGYTFTGWNPEVAETMSAENLTYTATWSINQYSMTFVLDNGEENVVKTQDYETELTAPADPVKTGFTFKGWEPAVPATIPAQNITFTAQWERNKYLLTFIVDGETYKQEEVLFEAAITKPEDPVKEGYTFTGWNPEVAETMSAENLTYTATWSINQYSMTFVLDNGEENVVKTQDYGTELTAPTDPVKTGFTFKGWEPAVPATIPAQDMTFTAQWERNKYLLTFIVDDEIYKQEEVLFEATITKPEDPVKDGYIFTGWNPEVAETMPAEDVTYTAMFEEIPSIVIETHVGNAQITGTVENKDCNDIVINSIVPESGVTTITIPTTIEGYTVVAIEDGTLRNISGVTDIYLQDTGESPILISDGALMSADGMATVHTPLQLLDNYAIMLPQFVRNRKLVTEVKQITPRYWTFSCGVDVEMPSDIEVNIIRAKEDKVEIVPLNTNNVKANNGVLLSGNEGTIYTLTALPTTSVGDDYTENLLEPVIEKHHYRHGEGYFVLFDGAFYAIKDDDTEIPSCKAVLHMIGAGAKASVLYISGDSTSINLAIADEESDSAPRYNTSGQRVGNDYKGIVIVNGKKIVVK